MEKVRENRFRDDGRSLDEFSDKFLVVCPQCRHCAIVIPLVAGTRDSRRRLFCPSCGHSKDGSMIGGIIRYPDRDWYFALPLWLNIPCCGNELWAFNARHLAWLEGYIAATLREQRCDPEHGWSNQSALNRLPAWIRSGKNRDEVLRGIKKLKDKLRKK